MARQRAAMLLVSRFTEGTASPAVLRVLTPGVCAQAPSTSSTMLRAASRQRRCRCWLGIAGGS